MPEREYDERLHDVIKQRAYGIWEREGRPEGRALQNWQQAEREVLAERVGGEEPFQQVTNPEPTAPPMSGERPGASAKLGGTPGNLSRDAGR